MNAVGIDVSKGKSTVTIRRPGDVILMPPCDIPHTQSICYTDLSVQIYHGKTIFIRPHR